MHSPGISNPFPGMLQSAIAARYNPFANADPLLPRQSRERVETWTVEVLLCSFISLSQDACLLLDGLM